MDNKYQVIVYGNPGGFRGIGIIPATEPLTMHEGQTVTWQGEPKSYGAAKLEMILSSHRLKEVLS